MTNINNNQLPLVEEIQTLKNEIPSWEEFLNNYQVDEKVESSYLAETQAQVLTGPQYGPGNSQSSSPHEQEKQIATGIGVGGAVATGVITFFCPPAGIALATTYATIGGTAKVVKNLSADEEVRKGTDIIDNVFGTAALGGSVAKVTGAKCLNHVH